MTVSPPSEAPRAVLKATLREPVVTREQVAGSTVVSYSATVAPVPAGMVTAVKDTKDPFNVMGAFPWDGQQVRVRVALLETTPPSHLRFSGMWTRDDVSIECSIGERLIGMPDGKLPGGGWLCGSFGLSRGSSLNPFI